MDLYDAIERRRTTRAFKGQASSEQLDRILEAATKAPSPGNNQCWEFLIVENLPLKEEIAKMKYMLSLAYPLRGRDAGGASVDVALQQECSIVDSSLILVFFDRGGYGKFGERTNAAAAWLAIGNMLLAAAAEGLGSKITSYWGDMPKAICALVSAPDNLEFAAAVSLGISAQEPAPRELRLEGSCIHRNRFP